MVSKNTKWLKSRSEMAEKSEFRPVKTMVQPITPKTDFRVLRFSQIASFADRKATKDRYLLRIYGTKEILSGKPDGVFNISTVCSVNQQSKLQDTLKRNEQNHWYP